MTNIKGLDGKPIRTTKTLEEIQLPDKKRLEQLYAEKGRLWNTPSEFTQHIDRTIELVESILKQKEEIYKQQVQRYISHAISNLQTQISLVYENQRTHPGVIGILLSLFLEWVLQIIQYAEIMEGTPKDMEICSNIGHEIHHIPVWEQISRTNDRVHQALLYGSYILTHRIDERRQSGEDDRLVAWFVHNPSDVAPQYLDTKCAYSTYGNDIHPDRVILRQLMIFAKPKNQTQYNLEMFEYMFEELWKVFDSLVKIIKHHK